MMIRIMIATLALSYGLMPSAPVYAAPDGAVIFQSKKCPNGKMWDRKKKKCVRESRGSFRGSF